MEESQSTTTASRKRIESSARSSWVDIEHIDPGGLNRKQWIRIASLLKPVVARSCEMNLMSLLRDVTKYDAAIWGVLDRQRNLRGIILCRVCEFPSGYSVFLVQACAVDGVHVSMKNRRFILEKLEDVARVTDCDAVRISGRAGWARVATGYTEVSRTLDKTIRKES